MQLSDRIRRWRDLLGPGVVACVLAACAPMPVPEKVAREAAPLVATEAPPEASAEPRNACELAQQRGAPRSRFCAPLADKPGERLPKAALPEPVRSDAARRGAAGAVPPESPVESVRESDQQGLASWYGPRFHGRRTASGEIFNRRDFTAAHRTLPFGTRVCVRSQLTGRAVVVRINDRGPFAMNRVIDVSQAAAQELGMQGLGIKPVELWLLEEGEGDCPQSVSAP
ncbi:MULTISPECIES: septal ring lytic transglycosylase RlpA family protein [unclassified Acidovorax]|uniref:septal ring lytic transglycosylase RlpA family protein n=1 Tax=unclassified Acidovorax TaxID=2684926 RepID=UPI001E5DA2D6|nr:MULTISPECIES: septal ring lytic transglycosylase RlpA family protein [unclassified Acidovorax]